MMHPKPAINSKRGHTCNPDQTGSCLCGPVTKRPTANGGEGGEDGLFSLVTVAEQQRQAQERGAHERGAQERGAQERGAGEAFSSHWNPLTCSAPPALPSRQAIFPPAERLITFTTASREYPHLRPVPLQELSSLKLFRVWVRRSFELKEDCNFVLVDRSVEAKNEEESGLIDSDAKLLRAKDIEIVEVPQEEADRTQEKESDSLNSSSSSISNTTNNSLGQNHQELLNYAKSILLFLSEKGNSEARSIVTAVPSSFTSCTPLSSIPSDPNFSLTSSTGALMSVAAPAAPPALPRIVAQAPPCLIPGYYIFSPVFDSFGEKRKLPIKIEIPRALVFNGERYKTVSTYIGLGPFGNDPNSFVKLEGDHLVGTVASRLEDDEEGNGATAANSTGATPMCTYVFKNLRLKTRSLIRTVLDVAYNGMRTGRFFFMVDNEVLPNTSRRFEIKAPSGYTIKMVNKTARSNPVAKHSQPTTPPPSTPSSPQPSRPPSPPETPQTISHSQQLSAVQRPTTPPPLQSQPLSPSAPQLTNFHQLHLPPSVFAQMKKHNETQQQPTSARLSVQPVQQQAQLYQQLQSFLYSPQSQPQSKSPRASLSSSSSGTASPPTMPKGFSSHSLAPPHTQLHTQLQSHSISHSHSHSQSHHAQSSPILHAESQSEAPRSAFPSPPLHPSPATPHLHVQRPLITTSM